MSHWRGIAAAIVAAALGIGAYGALLGGRSPAAGSAAGAGYVRVNQVGYPLSADKRAYLMTNVPAARAQFTVTDDGGRVVAAGVVGPDLGRWSRRYPHVYPIDFTRVRRAGTYAVSVGGPAPAQAVIEIGAGAALYAGPIRNALAFYRVQRDGAAIVRSALRTAPSHLNDADAMTYRTPKVDGDGAFKGDLSPLGVRMDASGGWWDAGDYLKFVQTTAYTDAVLLVGVRDFPAQMGAGSARRTSTPRPGSAPTGSCGCGTTARARSTTRSGSATGNDAIVERPRHLAAARRTTTPTAATIRRSATSATGRCSAPGPPGSPVSPNLAGRDAAALALCYQVFRTSDRRVRAQRAWSRASTCSTSPTRPRRGI